VATAIDAYGLIEAQDRVLVAVSGGPDSVALLWALVSLRDRYGITLGVAYLHHSLRASASAEQAFVAGLADQLALPFHTERRDVPAFRREHGLSLEDAARRMRYDFLENTAATLDFGKIAVGHQADDTSELVLMNLLRGSGPRGLAGIAPRHGSIIRPLIDIHRDKIMAYLALKKLHFRHDESNANLHFTRNRIRHELIPHLEAVYNPRLRQTLQDTARIIRDEETWLEAYLDEIWQHASSDTGKGEVHMDRSALNALPAALQRRVLRRALAEVAADLKGISFAHIEAIRHLASGKRADPRWMDLPKGIRILVDAVQIRLAKETAEARRNRRRRPARRQMIETDAKRRVIRCPGEDPIAVELPEYGARLVLQSALFEDQPLPDTPNQALFDLDRLVFPMELRPALPGDRLRPLGMRGHKKVSDLFIDCKVPKPIRRRHPVMVSGGRIIWLVGVRRDHACRIRKDTKRLLMGEFCLLK
jgi:tRNA(Ile)-lysidine synthase